MRPDEYSDHNPYYNQPLHSPCRREGFAIASLAFAILSLLALCTLILPLPLGALSLLFAHLSHRRKKAMYSGAVAGILLSCISIFLALILSVFSWFSLSVIMKDPAQRQSLEQSMESLYGPDSELILREMERLFP